MKFLDQHVRIGLLGIFGALMLTSTPVMAEDHITHVDQKEISSFDEQQIQCLAENIYFEASNQPEAGKIAVSNVVMNRTNNKKFPATPCKVIKQKIGRVCQFSWVCTKGLRVRDMNVFSESIKIAKKVYFSSVGDNTDGSLFFHAKHSRPSWSKVFIRTTTIGDHIFYRR